ncbi:molybdopterin molybdotransferase MoeA [Roseateles koreensis]|uniref:Molybdopterin molybdenumtransferase n=1 Tax=Roseateles koreensis TaxID=2987526 RepID=A0ABT5KLH4_9BURK|nr:gephyrin-like molybdotransferase Glp [Roseateles koreensis]MDC8783733.1 molybdopterin molybdotransferase MoeA [Roseateles koreensis]
MTNDTTPNHAHARAQTPDHKAKPSEAIRVDEAQAFIQQLSLPARQASRVPLRQALGRVVAEDVVSPLNVPAHDNAAMDGYAFASQDLQTDHPISLTLAGTSLAGQAGATALVRGQCQRIMTGAVMPAGLDTVVPQEWVQRAGDCITFPPGVIKPGDNRRLAGEDLRQGGVALQAGKILQPADIGLLASLGLGEVAVWPRLRVALLSTGNELCEPGVALGAGGIYDSNRYTLFALLERLGVEVLDLGAVRDEPAALRAAFGQAIQQADVVISSGGVSTGEADHTKAVMAEFGEVLFWQLAMRPGRPLAVGRVQADGHSALLFGLPGNPVAAMVAFYAFVRGALLRVSGAQPRPLLTVQAISPQGIRKKPGRTEFLRGIVQRNAQGQWQVELTGHQGSGILSSMSQANGLVVLPHEQGDIPPGGTVEVWPLDSLN